MDSKTREKEENSTLDWRILGKPGRGSNLEDTDFDCR
jgi:hypothetical protein